MRGKTRETQHKNSRRSGAAGAKKATFVQKRVDLVLMLVFFAFSGCCSFR
jgi:hypothetical protein